MARKKVQSESGEDAVIAKAIIDADTFIRAARERAAANKEYEKAKEGLKVFLGTAPSKVLPDGRTVSQTKTPREGYTVESGFALFIAVSPPPAA